MELYCITKEDNNDILQFQQRLSGETEFTGILTQEGLVL